MGCLLLWCFCSRRTKAPSSSLTSGCHQDIYKRITRASFVNVSIYYFFSFVLNDHFHTVESFSTKNVIFVIQDFFLSFHMFCVKHMLYFIFKN